MNINDNILQLIQEAYIFSDKTISVDLHKFESGEVDKLLISGLSGAGKTSTGNYLSKLYNVDVFDTDIIHRKISKEYPRDKYSEEIRIDKFKNEFKDILLNNKQLIICGVGIGSIYHYNKDLQSFILSQPFIFLGKSALKGSWDAYMRMLKTGSKKTIFDALRWNFKIYYDKEMTLRKDRCAVPGSVIEDFSYDYK